MRKAVEYMVALGASAVNAALAEGWELAGPAIDIGAGALRQPMARYAEAADYRTLFSNDTEALDKKVKKLMQEGWEPWRAQYAVAGEGVWYYQAMIRYGT